jgi:hypothetical protein
MLSAEQIEEYLRVALLTWATQAHRKLRISIRSFLMHGVDVATLNKTAFSGSYQLWKIVSIFVWPRSGQTETRPDGVPEDRDV